MSRLSRKTIPFRDFARSTALVFGLAFAGSAVLSVKTAFAQNPQAPRVVQGKVTDKGDTALKGATVYLKDGHTLSVRSYIASDDGTYRFGQLGSNTDYELWAESNGKKSKVSNLSSFDSRPTFNINLKIDTSK